MKYKAKKIKDLKPCEVFKLSPRGASFLVENEIIYRKYRDCRGCKWIECPVCLKDVKEMVVLVVKK